MDTPNPPTQAPETNPLEHKQRMGKAGGPIGQCNIGAVTTRERYVTGENASLPNAFYNDLDASLEIQREKPVHRNIIEHAIQGYSIKEIARLFDYTQLSVSRVLKQPWARAYMQQRMKEDTATELRKLLESETLPSLQSLIELRDAEETPAAVKANVANSILDRVLGKAAQPILTAKVDTTKLHDDELEQIIKQGRRAEGEQLVTEPTTDSFPT